MFKLRVDQKTLVKLTLLHFESFVTLRNREQFEWKFEKERNKLGEEFQNGERQREYIFVVSDFSNFLKSLTFGEKFFNCQVNKLFDTKREKKV